MPKNTYCFNRSWNTNPCKWTKFKRDYVNYPWQKDKWQIQIELPKTISRTLIWKGKKLVLHEGLNQIYE